MRYLTTFLMVMLAGTIPSSTFAQSDQELHRSAAVDYYVGVSIQRGEMLGAELTVRSLQQMAANSFVMGNGNTDDIISAQDEIDRARVYVAAYDVSAVADFRRYDLDNNDVVSQQELEISHARAAWLATGGLIVGVDTYADVRIRFEEELRELTSDIRDRANAPETGDVALSDSIARTYTLDDQLGQNPQYGPPYFAVFDLDGDGGVGADEYLEPMMSAVEAADVDVDGLFSEAEIEAMLQRQSESETLLDPYREKYALRPN